MARKFSVLFALCAVMVSVFCVYPASGETHATAKPHAWLIGEFPAGTQAQEYGSTIRASGSGFTRWTYAGRIPYGLRLNFSGNYAYLTGTPRNSGSFTFTLKASDSGGNSAEKSFTVKISPSANTKASSLKASRSVSAKTAAFSAQQASAPKAAYVSSSALPANNGAGSVAINSTNFPDDVFREYVRGFDENGDGSLSSEERNSVTDIDVNRMEIYSLKGIEHFPNLIRLFCERNHLTELDVSANTALDQLDFANYGDDEEEDFHPHDYNQNHTIDLSKNIALVTL
ncbi:MAG: hypothetical protein IJP54_08975, partial [Synergistaceae bacterium]|nr:hypothetical protein [Synergistaceae bacterium]